MIKKLLLLFFVCSSGFSLELLNSSQVEKRISLFDYVPKHTLLQEKLIASRKKYEIYFGKLEVVNHISKSKMIISYKYYKNKKKINRPLIILKPSIGGELFIERDLAGFFVSNGFNVLISHTVEELTDLKRPINKLQSYFIKMTNATQHLIDYMSTKNEIDITRIGLFGISLGALRSAIAFGVEDRIDAIFIIVGGGDIPEIFAGSSQERLVNYRESRMNLENILTVEDYRKKIEREMQIDPIYFASRRSSDDIFMIIGGLDRDVPTRNQFDLWRAFGRPDYIVLPTDHLATAGLYAIFRFHMLYFFVTRLNIDSKIDFDCDNNQMICKILKM